MHWWHLLDEQKHLIIYVTIKDCDVNYRLFFHLIKAINASNTIIFGFLSKLHLELHEEIDQMRHKIRLLILDVFINSMKRTIFFMEYIRKNWLFSKTYSTYCIYDLFSICFWLIYYVQFWNWIMSPPPYHNNDYRNL